MLAFRSPTSAKDFEKYFNFRWEQLRKPLDLERGSEQDDLGNSSFHIAAFKHEKILGVGRLQIIDDCSARIRYMAVDGQFRNQGIGSQLLVNLENVAKSENVETCWLYARESAVAFYLKNNYQIRGEAKSDLPIEHHRMEKFL